jgi:hypothetical protein
MRLVGALALVLALSVSACTGDDATKSAEGDRMFWPEHVVEHPDGSLWLVGIAQALGQGMQCGGEAPEVAEFTVIRLARSGAIEGVSWLPQDEVEGCAAEATHLSARKGAVAIDGLISLEPSELGATADMVRAVFEPSGRVHAEPSDRLPPEYDGILVSRDGTGFHARARWPRRPSRALVDALEEFEFKAFTAIVTQPDGKTVAAGELDRDPRRKAFAARVLPSGRPDPSFGKEGVVLLDIGHTNENIYSDAKAAMTVLRDGKVVLAASIRGRPTHVFRLDRRGRLDAAFGQGGKIVLPRV